MLLRFITSTPLDIRRGSGTYVGIAVLARAIETLGHTVRIETPSRTFPIFTLQRYHFNRSLHRMPSVLTVGFDLDGYTIAERGCPHVASLKGVIADEVRFEAGITRATMNLQARWERLHVHRAARVITTSKYAAEQARNLYELRETPTIVPELIELADWRAMLAANPVAPSERFTVLYVGRFYRRKRVERLLDAAAILAPRIPGLSVRIVGDGPCASDLHGRAQRLGLGGTVEWLGHVSRAQLAQEYNRAHVLCQPSIQEGFGIVFLEAMAAGKPIVAARAGASVEVACEGLLVDPDNGEALAAALQRLHDSPQQRAAMAEAGSRFVQQFDAPAVARQFLSSVSDLVARRAAS